MCRLLLVSGFSRRHDADDSRGLEAAVVLQELLGRKTDDAVADGVECIILADFDIRTRLVFRTALADEDGARLGDLAVLALDAQALAAAVSA